MLDRLLSHPDALYFIYTALAVGIFALLSGIYQLARRSENRQEARSRRMQMIAKGASTAEILAILKPPDHGSWATRMPFIGNLPKTLRQAGMTVSPARVVMICIIASVVLSVFALAFLRPTVAVVIGTVLGFAIPLAVIHSKRKQRIEALIKQLPDALDLMSRGLKVGHPLNTSIASVAAEMPDPIGTEFGLVADQVSFGDDLVDAFAEFSERVDIEDVHYLCASIGIQHGTGGDLARVIDVLSRVIRNRAALRRRIQAISAEGRMTAYFMSALPFFILGGTLMSNPEYYVGVMGDPLALPMAIVVVVLVILNALILKKLVNFRV